MSMNVSEKEIEIERLMTTVVALNGKCSVAGDRVVDFDNITNKFVDSENNR